MKNKFLLIAFSFIMALPLQAQDVPQVQQSLITKVTATWCINCGTWGWNLFEGLVEDNTGKALVIANHYSGDLNNATSDAIADNFNIFGQPRFILNDTDQNASSSSAANKRAEIKDQVDANYMMNPLANAGLTATLDGNMLTVNTKTRFFQAASGEYYIGVYIIEDGVINSQSGQGMNAVHKNVLRAGLSSNAFGELIINGNIGMNMEFDHEFTTLLDGGWKKDALTIATIIWKKEGDSYSFVNTHFTTTIGTATAVNEISADQLTMSVQPTVSEGISTLALNVVQAQEQLDIQLYNQQGQLVQSVFSGPLAAGQHTFIIGGGLTAGMYFVNTTTAVGVLTRRYIVR